jgi:hypothetical protein
MIDSRVWSRDRECWLHIYGARDGGRLDSLLWTHCVDTTQDHRSQPRPWTVVVQRCRRQSGPLADPSAGCVRHCCHALYHLGGIDAPRCAKEKSKVRSAESNAIGGRLPAAARFSTVTDADRTTSFARHKAALVGVSLSITQSEARFRERIDRNANQALPA